MKQVSKQIQEQDTLFKENHQVITENISKLKPLIDEYYNLVSAEKDTVEQQGLLFDSVEKLKKEYPELNTVLDGTLESVVNLREEMQRLNISQSLSLELHDIGQAYTKALRERESVLKELSKSGLIRFEQSDIRRQAFEEADTVLKERQKAYKNLLGKINVFEDTGFLPGDLRNPDFVGPLKSLSAKDIDAGGGGLSTVVNQYGSFYDELLQMTKDSSNRIRVSRLDGLTKQLAEIDLTRNKEILDAQAHFNEMLLDEKLLTKERESLQSAFNNLEISIIQEHYTEKQNLLQKHNKDILDEEEDTTNKLNQVLQDRLDMFRESFDPEFRFRQQMKDMEQLRGVSSGGDEGVFAGAEAAAFQELTRAQREARLSTQEWKAGAIVAFEEYSEAAGNAALNTLDVFGNAIGRTEDLFVNFFVNRKADFESFINAIIADMARLTVRQFITGKAANALAGAFAGGIGAGSSGAPAGGNTLADYQTGGFAHGGVFKFREGFVSREPSLLIGEGRFPTEAVIPLPDGKNIPVKMKQEGRDFGRRQRSGVVVQNYINAPMTIQTPDVPGFKRSQSEIATLQSNWLNRASVRGDI